MKIPSAHSITRGSILSLLWLALLPVIAATNLALAEEEPGEATAAVAEEAEAPPATGLNRPMDGSSVESFEACMKIAESELTPVEFRTLQNALAYLKFYDLSAKRDMAKVYKNLDGQTPAEIMQRVSWRTGKPPSIKKQ